MSRPRVVVLRGHAASPWELGAWELLADRFDVAVAVTRRNRFDVADVALERLPVRALRDRLPPGRLGDLAVHLPGDRYLGLEEALAGADVVHGAELGSWLGAQPASLKERLGFRLVLTIWETIPFLGRLLDPVRRRHALAQREASLAGADLFLAATERARRCLLLEGAQPERIVVSPPGVDVDRFAVRGERGEGPIVSPGRLVWEKGHYDVLRALAELGGDRRLLIVGEGRERGRLLRYAADLGVADRVDIGPVPYAEMPAVFASASAVVLASLATPIWEEQFGMVLAEAMAAGAPIVATASGAIPEVLDGSGAALVRPGDWLELAERLAATPAGRVSYPAELVRRYSTKAAAERLAAAYDRVLAAR